MTSHDIGFLHPGAMGVSIAAAAVNAGHTAHWVSAGRSPKTVERARAQGLEEARTLSELCERCGMLVSVCPPHAANEVAGQVLACSYQGLYADVNAISPQRAQHIGRMMEAAGVSFVDGGIIGGPAWKSGTTWLHVSGAAADQVAACFSAGPLEVNVMSSEIGTASALKMCFAANTKGAAALLCAVVAAAERLGVRGELERQWARYDAEQPQRAHQGIRGVTAKAWRFSGEMGEIADTLEEAALPGGFHRAAGDVYQRIARFKDAAPRPPLEDILNALLDSKPRGGIKA